MFSNMLLGILFMYIKILTLSFQNEIYFCLIKMYSNYNI